MDASNPQVRLSQTDGSVYGELKVDSSGDITITPSGDEVFIPDDNLRICSGGACPTPSWSGTGNLQVEGDVDFGCPSGWVKVTDRTCIMQDEANGGTALNWFEASDYCHDHYNARSVSYTHLTLPTTPYV